MTICSVRPSQPTTEVSRSTATWDSLLGTIAPQPQAYAGLISEPSCSDTSISSSESARDVHARPSPRTLCFPLVRRMYCLPPP
ncbi:hypothetical protein [Streptomyces gelaticus]|nr:hypothetical protein [Streptomyces gelaticus]